MRSRFQPCRSGANDIPIGLRRDNRRLGAAAQAPFKIEPSGLVDHILLPGGHGGTRAIGKHLSLACLTAQNLFWLN